MVSVEEVLAFIAACNSIFLLNAILSAVQVAQATLQSGHAMASSSRGRGRGRGRNFSSARGQGPSQKAGAGPAERAWSTFQKDNSDWQEKLNSSSTLDDSVVQRYIQGRLEQARRLGFQTPTFPRLPENLRLQAEARHPTVSKLVGPEGSKDKSQQPKEKTTAAAAGGAGGSANPKKRPAGGPAQAAKLHSRRRALDQKIKKLREEISRREEAIAAGTAVALGGGTPQAALAAQQQQLAELEHELAALSVEGADEDDTPME